MNLHHFMFKGIYPCNFEWETYAVQTCSLNRRSFSFLASALFAVWSCAWWISWLLVPSLNTSTFYNKKEKSCRNGDSYKIWILPIFFYFIFEVWINFLIVLKLLSQRSKKSVRIFFSNFVAFLQYLGRFEKKQDMSLAIEQYVEACSVWTPNC